MIKEILKRGIAGAIISLVAIISMLLGVLVVTGTSQITIQISEIIKYTFIIMVAGFIISSSTIIFSIKNMPLVIKGFIHLIITLLILNEDYLIQAIFISLYIIVAAICLITIISENKTDVKMINERLKIIQKIKD